MHVGVLLVVLLGSSLVHAAWCTLCIRLAQERHKKAAAALASDTLAKSRANLRHPEGVPECLLPASSCAEDQGSCANFTNVFQASCVLRTTYIQRTERCAKRQGICM
eukprot:3563979-Amphidinium_carterae.2